MSRRRLFFLGIVIAVLVLGGVTWQTAFSRSAPVNVNRESASVSAEPAKGLAPTDASASSCVQGPANVQEERALWLSMGVAQSAQVLTDLRHASQREWWAERQQFNNLGTVGAAQALTNQRHGQCGM